MDYIHGLWIRRNKLQKKKNLINLFKQGEQKVFHLKRDGTQQN